MMGPPKFTPNWLRLKVGFWKGMTLRCCDGGGLEVTGCVERGVADELVGLWRGSDWFRWRRRR